MRKVIDGIADIGSVLELRRGWSPGIITALVRIEGRPVGIIANDPSHLSGAIDTPGADKGARFLQLCDGFDIPVLSLIDCPGIMFGPRNRKDCACAPCSADDGGWGKHDGTHDERGDPQGLRPRRTGRWRAGVSRLPSSA